ncbi:Beta-hexosaminidase 2 [Smittium culicis]|uniref:Beta-hexosaminidase n=1 Tax=Smittium culicis TaxID=133412 RepID=A0A1R1XJU6_9FUNG|nr:Beta-hexosaminidase 2 [Smittium culicis]
MFKLTKVLFFGALIARETFALWPVPQSSNYGTNHITFSSDKLSIISGSNNDILSRAISRYTDLIKNESFVPPLDFNIPEISASSVEASLQISVSSSSVALNADTDEGYTLTVNSDGSAKLNSTTVYGAIRGLETFSQLVISNSGRKIIKNTPITIQDAPQFKYRGLLLDTARHFFSVKSIKKILDGMAYTKLNVFHWHITDSQSWAVECKFNPSIHQKCSYGPNMVYMYSDVNDIISYARDRGIRVIPEFDLPGHTQILSKAIPDLMSCVNILPNFTNYAAAPPTGQINIAKPEAFKFTTDLVSEYTKLFTDDIFHVGGDEVYQKCWADDPYVINHLQQNPGDSVTDLLFKYYDHIYDSVIAAKKTPMCWEETALLKKGADYYNLTKEAVVQIWKSPASYTTAIDLGHKVVLSIYLAYYLDCGHGTWLSNAPATRTSWCDPYKTWNTVYSYDPLAPLTTPERMSQLLGGEIAHWNEQNDEFSIEPALFPRVAAFGEIYWSGPYNPGTRVKRSIQDATIRISDFRERLVARGFDAEAIQPLWCTRNPGSCMMDR